MTADDDEARDVASAPCFLNELDAAERAATGPRSDAGLKRWRKSERERLIGARMALDSATRREYGERIADRLQAELGPVRGLTIGTYWPFRGEPDLRPLMQRWTEAGGVCALPIVIEPARPLIFRAYRSGDRLERGVWNIPIPADGDQVVPDVVIAPVVGFDPLCFRLGYGGGFFDRTLDAMAERPRFYGVGYDLAAIPTIDPRPYDIPMDAVVTESRLIRPQSTAAST